MPTKAQIRTALIDPALTRAGWNVADTGAWQQFQSTLRQLKQQGVSYAGELSARTTDPVRHQADHLFQTLLHRSFRGA
ncbi:MAG: hypothetical protein KBG20_13065 [Caldilineaceae bacterium]|nr:hypothetical protein [Caldilineaceae bacterium]MBP8109486.1 hypothetical protein [Caldilineaceae bacterium]MBP8124209.1 hypothetical protein [Caldilineaceae bacterium]MBP9073227.1 hypothetical protein [Caldilineaceae bacterium]